MCSILLLQGLIVAFEKKGLNIAKGVNPRCVRQCQTTLPFPDYDAWVHKCLGMRLVSTVLCWATLSCCLFILLTVGIQLSLQPNWQLQLTRVPSRHWNSQTLRSRYTLS